MAGNDYEENTESESLPSDIDDAVDGEGSLVPPENRLADFIRTIKRFGLSSHQTRRAAQRMSPWEISMLRHLPEFSDFLDGIALKALFSGDELSDTARWAMKFLKDPGKGNRSRGYGMPASIQQGQVIEVHSQDEGAVQDNAQA